MLLRLGPGILVVLLFGVGPLGCRPPSVSPEAIATAITHPPALLEKAWALPAAKLYHQPLHVNETFQPWLVERTRLFAAIESVDSSSGKKRGLLEVAQ